MPIDWNKVRFTPHMVEAAAVIGTCDVVFDFEGDERATYTVRVCQALKGCGDDPYFAVGTNAADPEGFRPLGSGASPEAALEACLAHAGVHHRRRVKQAHE